MPAASQKRRRGRRLVTLALITGLALIVLALRFLQHHLIYFPRAYAPVELEQLPRGLVALRDEAEERAVVGFYRPPRDGATPQRLWLVFGGNGDQALGWDELLAPLADDRIGFLMIEYPGYGARPGRPSPESLLAGAETTVAALAKHLGQSEAEVHARSSLLGYSIGGAVALAYAARRPVPRIVLLAPFTSMLEMARRTVGSPLCHLLTHRFDNIASLRAVGRNGAPELYVLHGDRDSLIPWQMGRALASEMPGAHFELVRGADHGSVGHLAQERLRQLLTAP